MFQVFLIPKSEIKKNNHKFPVRVNSGKSKGWFLKHFLRSSPKLYVQSCEVISNNKKKKIKRAPKATFQRYQRTWSLQPCSVLYCYFFKTDPLLMFPFSQKLNSWFKELVWKPNLTRLTGSVTGPQSKARFINTAIFSLFFSVWAFFPLLGQLSGE